MTLQDHFEAAEDEPTTDHFLSRLDKSLDLLCGKLYENTMERDAVSPYRSFGLQAEQQVEQLKTQAWTWCVLDLVQDQTWTRSWTRSWARSCTRDFSVAPPSHTLIGCDSRVWRTRDQRGPCKKNEHMLPACVNHPGSLPRISQLYVQRKHL